MRVGDHGPSFDVIIPFRAGPPERLRNLQFVLAYYRRWLPGAWIIVVEHGTRTPLEVTPDVHLAVDDVDPCLFNKSLLLNSGYRESLGSHLVLADADCVPEVGVLTGLGRGAFAEDRYVVLHDRVQYLPAAESESFVADGQQNAGVQVVGRTAVTVGGATLCPAGLFHELGGFDQRRYLGWGGEDDDFYNRAYVRRKTAPRVPAQLLHLYHPPAVDRPFTPEAMAMRRARIPAPVVPHPAQRRQP